MTATLTTILVSLAVIVVAGWLVWAWWFPNCRCFACKGSKTGLLSTRRALNHCHWCQATGLRTRFTARLISKATGRPVRGPKKRK